MNPCGPPGFEPRFGASPAPTRDQRWSVQMRARSFWIAILCAAVLVGCRSGEQTTADHLKRGEEYQEQKKYAEAVIEYKNVLQIDPNNATAHYELAKSHLQLGQAREGFWELRETVRLDPKNH